MHLNFFNISREGLPDAGEVRAAQMASFASLTRVNALVTVTTALFVAALLWPVAPHSWVAAWAGALIGLSAMVIYREMRRGPRPPRRSVSVRGPRRATVWAAGSGVLWGSGAIFLPAVPSVQQLALIIVISAMAAGASSTLGAIPLAATLFIFGALVPPAAYFALQGEPVYFALSALAMVMAFGMVASTRIVYFSFIEALRAKQANTELLQQIRAERQDWLDVSGTTEAFALFDAENRLLLWNEAYRRLFDLPEGLLGRGMDRQELVRKGAVPVEVAEGHVAIDDWVDRQMNLPDTPDRATVDLLTTRRWIRSHARRTSAGRVIAIHVDVTEIKFAEEQLLQSRKMESIGQLTGGIAHDFNNQLGVIMGNLSLLDEHVATDPDARKLIEAALYAAKHSAELTRSLLAFARRQPLRPRIIDIGEFIAECVRLIDRTLGEAIEIKLSRQPGTSSVLVDEAQLSACIINLANNARDAMPQGGTLTISVRDVDLDKDYAALHPEVADGHYVAIEVSDTGTGMTPEALGKAFEPFFTTKEVGKGTGLGLSMVHGFVKQSAGHVEIRSEIGRGTTVRIYLPRVAEQHATRAPAAGEPAKPAGGSETVLMVEDNEGVRQIVAAQLAGLGYRVLEAGRGWDALAILERPGQAIDLLFTDIVMPGGMDGYKLARAAIERHPDLKVLLTSGFPGQQPEAAGERGTDLPLLSKPYNRDDLARAIRAALHPA